MRPKKSLIIFYRTNKYRFLFVFIFIIFLVSLLICTRLFSITHISLSGAVYINGLDRLSRKNIFFISIPKTEKNLYNTNPSLQSVKVTKVYPSTLNIVVQKAEPVAQLRVKNGFFLLAHDGRIIAKQRNKTHEITLIKYYQQLYFNEYESGEILTKKDILFGAFFVYNFLKLGITVDSVDIINLNMIVLQVGDRKYIFTADKGMEAQFEAFKTIYPYMNVEGIEYKSLDMRFEKPIIKI